MGGGRILAKVPVVRMCVLTGRKWLWDTSRRAGGWCVVPQGIECLFMWIIYHLAFARDKPLVGTECLASFVFFICARPPCLPYGMDGMQWDCKYVHRTHSKTMTTRRGGSRSAGAAAEASAAAEVPINSTTTIPWNRRASARQPGIALGDFNSVVHCS